MKKQVVFELVNEMGEQRHFRVDPLLPNLLALRLGEVPGSNDAVAAVKQWLQARVDRLPGRRWPVTHAILTEAMVLAVVDAQVRHCYEAHYYGNRDHANVPSIFREAA